MKKFSKYWSIFEITLLNSLAYPGELVGRSLMIIPFMWIFYQLWKVAFSAAGVDAINGLTLQDTLWYLMMTETIELGRPPIARTMSENVKDGSVAYILNKPYDFLWYQFSSAMGETIFRAIMNAIFGGLTVWLLIGAPAHPQGFLVAIPAVLGAWVLHFCINAMIGLSAFVVEDVAAFTWIYQKLAFIFGGMLIPLDFYPQWMQTLAKAMPFSSALYGPARLFVSPTMDLFIGVMSLQMFWIITLVFVLVVAYRRGLTQLTVNGG